MQFRSQFAATDGMATMSGLLSGVYLLTWLQQFFAYFGTSLSAVSAVGLSVAAAVAWNSRMGACNRKLSLSRFQNHSGPFAFGCIQLILAVWTIVLPWLVKLAWLLVSSIPLETIAILPFQLTFFVLVSAVVLGVPIGLLVSVPRCFCSAARSCDTFSQPMFRRRLQSMTSCYFLGVAAGILINIFCFARLFGFNLVGLLAALVGCCIFMVCSLRSLRPSAAVPGSKVRIETSLSIGELENVEYETSYGKHRSLVSFSAMLERLWLGGALCCVGILLAVLFRLIPQLMPSSSWLFATQWSILIVAAALGMNWSRRHVPTQSGSGFQLCGDLPLAVCLFAASWAVLLLSTFPLLVALSLRLNAHVSHVWMLTSARALLVGVILFPIGVAWGTLATIGTTGGTIPATLRSRLQDWLTVARGIRKPKIQASPPDLISASLPRFGPLLVLSGFLLARWFLLIEWGCARLTVVTAWCLVLLAGMAWVGIHKLSGWRVRHAVYLAVVGMVVLIPLWSTNYDPARSAKLLFDTNILMAHRSSWPDRLLPYLDDGRCLEVREADRSTYTVWKYRGSQIQIRESGIPKGVISRDPRTCPQFSAEVIHAVMPLIVHQRPRRVLLLGLGGGAPLVTSLAFPIQELVCVEADQGLIDTVAGILDTGSSPLEDDRVRLLPLDPVIAINSKQKTYDVIVCNPDQSALMQAIPYSTLEYYKQAADNLSPHGIFCQRFQYLDFGAESIQTLAATMQAAFRQVVAVEPTPGVLLFLGANFDRPFFGSDFAKKLQAPHVRRVLSQLGWDWSVVLNLSVCPHDSLRTAYESRGIRCNTGRSGRFAVELPFAVMRWGRKIEEARLLLSKNSASILQLVGDGSQTREVQRRLREMESQRELMRDSSHEYRTYRSVVKEQVSKNPRSVIRQVSGEMPRRTFHPEDRRRMAYFEVLAEATRRKNPSLESLQTIAAFAAPYDPLISYFLHREVAELHARKARRDYASELAHRLYAIYYASPGDRSIRNVVSALKLLAEESQCMPDAKQRWDHTNGLLQVLASRWNLRRGLQPKSVVIAMKDVEVSLSATERSFQSLEQLAREIGFPEDMYGSRKRVLERSLMRPLRTYRSRLLPHQQGKRSQ